MICNRLTPEVFFKILPLVPNVCSNSDISISVVVDSIVDIQRYTSSLSSFSAGFYDLFVHFNKHQHDIAFEFLYCNSLYCYPSKIR